MKKTIVKLFNLLTPEDHYLSVHQYATKYGISTTEVYNRIMSGEVTAVRVGKHILIVK